MLSELQEVRSLITQSLDNRTAADRQKAAKIPLWQGVIAYFSNALQAVGAISRMGAAKHNEGKMPTKWRDYPVEVYADALARHITEEGKGDLYDSESNMLHAGHEAWNALARLEKLLEVHPLVKPQILLAMVSESNELPRTCRCCLSSRTKALCQTALS